MNEVEYLNKRIDITTWAVTQLARLLGYSYPNEVGKIARACDALTQELKDMRNE